MKPNKAVATSVGLLVWAWTFTSFTYLEPRVSTWITFLTWASFFAAGGGTTGLTKSIASAIFGILASAAVMWVDSQLGSTPYPLLILSILLGVLGWLLCTVSTIPLLNCIPATFIGSAAFFGAGGPLDTKLLWVLCSATIGALLGFGSQQLARALTGPTATMMPSQDASEKQSVGPG